MKFYSLNDYLNSDWDARKAILKKVYFKMKLLDICSIIFSLIGFVFIQIDCDQTYSAFMYETPEIIKKKEMIVIRFREYEKPEYSINDLRIVVLVLTLILDLILIIRSRIYFLYMKMTNKIEIEAFFYSTNIFRTLLIELILNSLISLPNVNESFEIDYMNYPLSISMNQIFAILQFLRIYLLYRVWAQYSRWNEEDSIFICNLCNTSGGIIFSLKAELKNRPIFVVSFNLLVTIMLMGVAVRISEISYSYTASLNWDYIWNGMWMIMITETTVGYGDFYPKTIIGRIISLIYYYYENYLIKVFATCAFGPFLISLVNVVIVNLTSFTQGEQTGYNNIKKKEGFIKLRHSASNCIKHSVKYWGYMNMKFLNHNSKKIKFDTVFSKFKDSILTFMNEKNALYARYFERSFDENLFFVSDKFDGELGDMCSQVEEMVNNINFTLKNIIYKNADIDHLLGKTKRSLSNIQSYLIKINKRKSFSISKPYQLLKPDTYRDIPKISSENLIKRLNNTPLREKLPTIIISPKQANSNKCSRKNKHLDTYVLDYDDMVKQLKKHKKKICQNQLEITSSKNLVTKKNTQINSATLIKNNKKLIPIEEREEIKGKKINTFENVLIKNSHFETLVPNSPSPLSEFFLAENPFSVF